MKLKTKIISIIVISMMIIIFIGTIVYKKREKKQDNKDTNVLESVSDETTIEQLKKDTGIMAENDLYEVKVEYDGKKVLNIKPEIQYKIAFAGIIKRDKFTVEEVENIFEDYYPKNSGIWIDNNSKEKFIKMLEKETNNKYKITKEGFLEIESESTPNDIDSAIKEMIESNKKYIVTISGIYYEADIVTGEILDNFYEDMDPYQATKSVSNNEDVIIFISSNSKKMLSEEEILQELISYK